MEAVIRNTEALAVTPQRIDALAIAEAGYAAVNVAESLRRRVRLVDGKLSVGEFSYPVAGRRVRFIGIGKCAITAARAVEEILGGMLTDGVALDVSGAEKDHLKTVEAHIGTHPLPSEENVRAAERITTFLVNGRDDDLVIMLISGGGSTLLCLPGGDTTCTDERMLFKELTRRGAPIEDLNTVRKHTSRIRGGGLAAAAYPAEILSFIVSDVPGNDLSIIASGPTVRDTTTTADARAVLARYGYTTPIELLETSKEGKYFERVRNLLFLSNEDALKAMQEEASRRGYAATIADNGLVGEAQEVAKRIETELRAAPSKTVLLYAGETTVTLPENAGAGGRNQELALAALEGLQKNELVLPFASDGHDNTDHAGAIADAVTQAHALAKRLVPGEYLRTHRSYDFFSTTGDALQTGYTGSNVSDFVIALKQ